MTEFSIYQINMDRDTANVCFLGMESLEIIKGTKEINAAAYDRVYDGKLYCNSLETIYKKFNVDHPADYKGRSLSVSDVVEIRESDTLNPGFYFVDSIGFNSIPFDKSLCGRRNRSMEQNGHTYEPIRDNLPEQCYSLLPGSNDVIIIKRNEKGYYKTDIPATSKEDARALVDEYNGKLGVTRAQEEAMKTGSMFGWNVPGADPKNYDMDGKPLKPKDRGDAR